ncbi:MAG: class I SAM-dependent methyltransferase [Gammaproteobacteria bacterium]
MDRIPEPELMDDEAQARAYAQADFSEPHSRFVDYFKLAFPHSPRDGTAVDLGCGPADVTARFACAFPQLAIDGVDGAEVMLRYGQARLRQDGLTGRVRLVHQRLPGRTGLRAAYDIVISNSLLHHLSDPLILWDAAKALTRSGGRVFVMDLARPENRARAEGLVDRYAAGEPPVLQRDFLNSLLAAYEPEEARAHIDRAGLRGFTVKPASDRHWIAYGWR